MGWRGGHLGASVSALVDGQLSGEETERGWAHVAGCPGCQQAVERETWVKRRLASLGGGGTPEHLAPALHGLAVARPEAASDVAHDAAAAWATVAALERRSRSRRRAGLAVAGAGSVSAAVLGLTTLGGVSLSIGGAGGPATSTPASADPRFPLVRTEHRAEAGARASVHGQLPRRTPGR